MSNRQKVKRWCFTINNPTEADVFWNDLEATGKVQNKEVNYIILQEERGENGTLHYQGMIIFKDQIRLSQLKKINARAHWEVMRGTPEQARDYCRKDDTYTGGLRYEYGKIPEREPAPKASERLAAAAEELDSLKVAYKRPAEIPSMTLMQCGFIPAMKELTADILGPYRPKLQIITLIGPPGSGKSYCIQKFFPQHGRCIVGNNGVWFQQPLADVMVFEEFCGQIQLQRMLQYLDPYPLALEIKGGMRPAMYTTVVITSNTPPCGWYKNPKDPNGAMDAFAQKRDDALYALYDRIGYAFGAFKPVRTCGHYIEAPPGTSPIELRPWFWARMTEIMGAEPIEDDEEDKQAEPVPLRRCDSVDLEQEVADILDNFHA